MRMGIALISCLLAAIALADDNKRETISLTGKVVAADGKPVAGATVEFRSDDVGRDKQNADLQDMDDLLRTATADEKGEFSFSNVVLPPDPYFRRLGGRTAYLLVKAPGHGVGWKTIQLPGEKTVELKMTAAAAVRGRVVDEAGKPVANAKISVTAISMLGAERYSTDTHHNFWRTKAPLATASDADGRFSITDLPKDARIDLLILHESLVRAGAHAATTDKPQPSVTEYRTDVNGRPTNYTEPVHITDFNVMLKTGHRVTGTVVFEDTGEPAPGVTVGMRGEESGFSRAVTDAKGQFTCGQLARGKGTYAVSPLEHRDYVTATGAFEIPGDKDEATLEPIKLPRGAIVAGKVLDEETGKGIAGVNLYFQVQTQARNGRGSGGTTQDDGSFRLIVLPGTGTVIINGVVPGYVTGPGYVRNPPSDDSFAKTVTAKLDSPVTDVTFKLGKGLTVTGRAVDGDGKPVAGAKVMIMNQFGGVLGQSQPTTDADGKFTLPALNPQSKHDFVIIHEQRKLAGMGSVKAAKDQKRVENVEVKLEALAAMTGRVLDEEKKPLAEATVYAYVMQQMEEQGAMYFTSFSPFTDRIIKTDKDGKFTLDFLIPGMQSYAYVSKEGFTQANSAQAKLAAGERKDVGDLTLAKADQTVGGVVVDPAGKPIAGMQVYAYSRRGGSFVSSSEQVVTDKHGRFKISNLPRGPVDINVMVPREDVGAGTMMQQSTRAESGRDDVRVIIFTHRKPAAAEALVGKPAPEFPVASWHNGKAPPVADAPGSPPFTRAAFQGKVVLLAFVDEAKPSQRVLPQLQTLQEKLREQGLFILRVHEGSNVEELAKLSPLAAAIVPGGVVPGYAEAVQKYGVRATPTLFLIDKQGILRYVDVKPEEVENKIRELLK